MSCGSEIGELSVKNDSDAICLIEWTIRDIFSPSYTVRNIYFFSPGFSKRGSRWYFRIYPKVQTMHKSFKSKWVSLQLQRDTNSIPAGVSFSLGVKKGNGNTKRMGEEVIWLFDECTNRFEIPQFLKRTELLRRKLELAPADALTVTCSFRTFDETCYNISMNTLSENLAELFASKTGCDVTLKVRDEEFPVHKYILTSRSTVFAAMFQADMKEQQTGVVEIEDCDPGAFRDFLAYLYTGKFRLDSNRIFDLYKIGDKYGVTALMSSCVLSIMSNLSLENACESVILARRMDLESLKLKTELYFKANFGDIIHTASWLSLLKEDMLLANDLLQLMAS